LADYLQSKLLVYDEEPRIVTLDPFEAEIVTSDSEHVTVLDYNVNMLKLKTNFSQRKFVVYNDNYYTGWQAFIDGKFTELFRSNRSFKGIWVPAGDHTVFFRYGSVGLYVFKYFMMGLFNVVFFYLMFESVKFVRLKKVT